jgi:hypothetical protein
MPTITRNDLTADEVRALFDYDQDTGIFTWRVSPNRAIRAGSIAGCCSHPWGYRRIGIGGTHYLAHRLAVLWVKGKWPREEVNHINGKTDDNRWCNLREATNAERARNCRHHVTSPSPFKGVFWSKAARKWQAQITVDQKRRYLGCFSDPKKARAAYRKAAIKHYDAFARLA